MNFLRISPAGITDPSVLLHFAQFVGHCAAIDSQIVGKLLAVVGNREMGRIVCNGLLGQIGNEPVAQRARSSVHHPAGKG